MNKPRIKICGITRVEDAQLAKEAGADAIGVVFFEKSARSVSDLALASQIARAAGPFVTVTALFVNASPEWVEEVITSVPINLLQFHGQEDRAWCEQFSRPYIKALRVKEDMDIVAEAQRFSSASAILLDTYKKGVAGGTGETFNWQRVPAGLKQPLILAGGLGPHNVRQAIRLTSPYALDVSGGVEKAAGIKDKNKIIEFINNARALGG